MTGAAGPLPGTRAPATTAPGPAAPRTAAPATAPRVLLVDDDQALLDALRRRLYPRFDVTCALGGLAALQTVRDGPPFAVVVSDMRMPDLDGVGLLRRLKQRTPDTIRIMMTGYADVDSAIAAVNEGWTFRFLTKPCGNRELVRALDDAVEQHRLVTVERQVLEETLRGAVQALSEVLSLAAPVAFERGLLVRARAAAALEALGETDHWEVEVAGLLAQLGMVSLPESTAEKLRTGAALDPTEQQMVARLPALTDRMLAGIPRLEGVRLMVADQLAPTMAAGAGPGSRLLRIAAEAVDLERRGEDPALLRSVLRSRHPQDHRIVDAVAPDGGNGDGRPPVQEVAVTALVEGMVLLADIRTADGRLVVGRNQVVTTGMVERLRNFRGRHALTDRVPVTRAARG